MFNYNSLIIIILNVTDIFFICPKLQSLIDFEAGGNFMLLSKNVFKTFMCKHCLRYQSMNKHLICETCADIDRPCTRL